MKYLYLPLFCLVIFFGCKKNDTPKKLFTFTNVNGGNTTVILYATPDDYFNGTNAVKTIHVDGNSTNVDMDELGEGKEYYADWFTNDYSVTNWANSATKENIKEDKFNIYFSVTTGKSFVIQKGYPQVKGSIRAALLNDKSHPKWRAIDAYRFSPYNTKRIWDSLSSDEKNVTLNVTRSQVDFSGMINGIRKDCHYDLLQQQGRIYIEDPTSKFNYGYLELSYPSLIHIQVYNAAVPVTGEIYNEHLPENTPFSNDTISVYVQGYMSYIMVRQ